MYPKSSGIQYFQFLVVFLLVLTKGLQGVDLKPNLNMTFDPTLKISGFKTRCIVRHKFVVKEELVAPDNFIQVGNLINGQFPGPTIEAFEGDILEVEVHNEIQKNLTIHWHGIKQQFTTGSDGVPQVTQYGIPPNTTFTYKMHLVADDFHKVKISTHLVGQTGTFMYHAHTNFDITWIHGCLIIKDDPKRFIYHPEYKYDEDRLIVLQELYHDPMDKIINGFNRNLTLLQITSLLINGQSYGNWTKTFNANSPGYSVVDVTPGLTYRFRIINLTPNLFLRFSIDGHEMRVMEMDGILIKPVKVDHVDIYTGERYSALVTIDQPLGNYFMRSLSMPARVSKVPSNGLSILHYAGAEDPTPLRSLVFTETILPPKNNWIASKLYPNLRIKQSSVYPIPKKVDRTIFIDSISIEFPNVNYTFIINHHLFELPAVPYLFQVRNKINITNEPQVFEILTGDSVDVILQNRVTNQTGDGICESHPWHFHGMYFYVVASGPDEYDEDIAEKTIQQNLKTKKVQFRDTFTQYPLQKVGNFTPGAGCGWDVVRFQASNPGVWLAHCHITNHFELGKGFVIWQHSKNNPWLNGIS